MKIRNIKKEYGITFRDESSSEFIVWDDLEKDIMAAGFPSGAVAKKFESGGDFSFEADDMKFRCKIHAVQFSVYSSDLIGCFVRCSNNPKATVTSIRLSKKIVKSISTNIRVDESRQEIAEIIARHFEESLSPNILVRCFHCGKVNINRICQKIYHERRLVIASLVSGFVFSTENWNREIILKLIYDILMKFITKG